MNKNKTNPDYTLTLDGETHYFATFDEMMEYMNDYKNHADAHLEDVADARSALIDAFLDYVEVITGSETSDEDRKALEKDFIALEEYFSNMRGTLDSVDKAIEDFLKNI